MTEAEAYEALRGRVPAGPWIKFDEGRDTVCLDGDFTADSLRAIADALEKLNHP